MNIKVPFCLLNPVWLGKQKSHVVETSDWKEPPTLTDKESRKVCPTCLSILLCFFFTVHPTDFKRDVIQTCACVLIESLYKSSALSTWDA